MSAFFSYDGKEPYIFISYAHKDYSAVKQFLQFFSSEKYRFWYDEGIKSGAEWSDYIVERISNAGVFVVFLSQNAIGSENVKDEIHVAVSACKRIIVVKLEDVVLTGGLLLKLDRRQAVNYYNCTQKEAFKKISSLNEINNCIEISLDDVFITYPNECTHDGVLSIAERISSLLKKHGISSHIDQKAKINKEGFLDIDLEIGRLNEVQQYLLKWIKEQNDAKFRGCSTFIIVLTSFSMHNLGYSVSETREYYYAAKKEGKRVLFVLEEGFCVPSDSFIPRDIVDEVKSFGIPASIMCEEIVKKLGVSIKYSEHRGEIDLSNMLVMNCWMDTMNTISIVKKAVHYITLRYDFSKDCGAFSYGFAQLHFDEPILVSTEQTVNLQLSSQDQSICSVQLEAKLTDSYFKDFLITQKIEVKNELREYAIVLDEQIKENTKYYLRELRLMFTPSCLSPYHKIGLLTVSNMILN